MHREGKDNYLDQLYNIMSLKEGYINPTTDGNLSWCSVISSTFDLDNAMENWQNRMHKYPCVDVQESRDLFKG